MLVRHSFRRLRQDRRVEPSGAGNVWASAWPAEQVITRLLLLTAVVLLLWVHIAAAQTNAPIVESSDDPTWKPALRASLRLLLLDHGTRVASQQKTRRELGGPFWTDYRRSVKLPRTWGDGDERGVNYVGHPIHGAAAGLLWLNHDRRYDKDAHGRNWSSKRDALLCATAYSMQFEFGPLSEASVGNVGLKPRTAGWVDHVVTPAGALGFIVGEEAVDRHVVTRIEAWTANPMLRPLSRMALNPSRTWSNTAQGRAPWHRASRSLQN